MQTRPDTDDGRPVSEPSGLPVHDGCTAVGKRDLVVVAPDDDVARVAHEEEVPDLARHS